MRKVRTQFRLFDIYRIIQDGFTDTIAHIKDAVSPGDWLRVTITDMRGNLYATEYCNVDTIEMRKAAVRQINKRLKEASTHE